MALRIRLDKTCSNWIGWPLTGGGHWPACWEDHTARSCLRRQELHGFGNFIVEIEAPLLRRHLLHVAAQMPDHLGGSGIVSPYVAKNVPNLLEVG